MTALQAARERLDGYIEACLLRAKLQLSEPVIDPYVLRRLEDDLVMAGRLAQRPF